MRHWRRTYRRQRAHRRALNNLLWTSCRLMAIGLIGVAFLFYRLDMPGTMGLFTYTAETDMINLQAKWDGELITVVYWQGQGQGGGNDRFQTNSNKEYVKFIINAENVVPDSVYLVYNEQRVNPNWKPGDSDRGFDFLADGFVYGNNKQWDWDFGSFLKKQMKATGDRDIINVTLFWKLIGDDDTLYNGTCQLSVQMPGGKAQVDFEILSTADRGAMPQNLGLRSLAGAEWLVANIQLLEEGSAADIDINSIRLVYDESYLEPERSELAGDTLRVYFNRSVVDTWLQDLGVQGGEVLLTITGEFITDDGPVPFSASNYYQMAFGGEEAAKLFLRIEGPDAISFPPRAK